MSANGATETATLISALAGLAWPVAVVVLVLTFRRTIAEQLGRLQTFKAVGTEATFEARVDDALRQSAKLAGVSEVSAARQAHLIQLASTEPNKAIRRAWEVVRESAQALARRREIAWSTTKDFAELLEQDKELDSDTVQLILNLRSLRYDVVDDPQEQVTPTTATAYVTAATSVADLLSKKLTIRVFSSRSR
jgi:hypothetical protein